MSWNRVIIAATMLFLADWAAAQTCALAPGPLAFGAYRASAADPLETTGTIQVECSQATAFIVKLDAGMNSEGSFHTRKLFAPQSGDLLAYNLFRDPGLLEIWGDGSSGTFVVSPGRPKKRMSFTVYGAVLPDQAVSYGSYSDTITVVVEW